MAEDPPRSSIADAAARLAHLPGPRASEGDAAWKERVAGLADLVAWASALGGPARLQALSAACREDADAAARLRDAVLSLAEGGRSDRLLTEAGLPRRLTIAEEVVILAVRSVIPLVRDSRDLVDVMEIVFGRGRAPEWLASLPPEALGEVAEAAGLDAAALWPGLRLHLAEAVRVHAVDCAAVGLAADVREDLGNPPVADSPFHRLAGASHRLLEALRASPPDVAAAAVARGELEGALVAAQAQRKAVIAHLESTGVSMDLVRRLEVLRKEMGRIGRALPVLAPQSGERPSASGAALLQMIAGDVHRERGLGSMFRERSRLLAKKIAERTGRTGTHYVTASWSEWKRMLWMGIGGGLVMAVAVAMKTLFHHLHAPPFWVSFQGFLVYAAAFVAIFALHWTLATKQPPATAAALADSLSAMKGGRNAAPVVDLLAKISRSQVAGLLGNVLGVAIMGVLLDVGWSRATGGSHIFNPEEAEHFLESHHLFRSASLPLAVLTGCAVWLSSMCAGWVEDAAAYGHFEQSVAAGGTHGRRLLRWTVCNIGGVVGNVSLAFFLVVLSFSGKVTGLPIDVRHVTVSSGSVVMSCLTLDQWTTSEVGWAAAGVLFIGALNILTGFAISLWVALRSRNASAKARVNLWRALFATHLGNPIRFLIPAGEDAPQTAPAPPPPH
jgi:site-specific recombinase